MSKTRDTGYLANVIQVHDTGVRIMSGSEMLMAISSSGAVTITGELSGSDAANALLLSGTGSVGFTTTGSFNTASGSLSSRTSQIEQVYATTGSNSFRATQSITGSLTVTGQIIAQTLNVQQVTSSIVYSSGSNTFGCDINSRQTFTGSFYQTGSVANFSNQVCIGSATTAQRSLVVQAGSTNQAIMFKNAAGGDATLYICGNATATHYGFNTYSCSDVLYITNCGNIGLGINNPVSQLHLKGTISLTEAGFNTCRIHSISHSHSDGSSCSNYISLNVSDGAGAGAVTAERMRINGSGALIVAGNVCACGTFLSNVGASTGTYGFLHCGSGRWGRIGMPNSSFMYLETNSDAGVYIDGKLQVANNTCINGAMQSYTVCATSYTFGGSLICASQVRIGNHGFSTAYVTDGIWGATATPSYIIGSGYSSGFYLGYLDNGSGLYGAAYGFSVRCTDGASNKVQYDAIRMRNAESGVVPFYVTNWGNIYGTSKNFRIDHPIPSMKDTHYLIHTSIEGPQADLIYRGKVELVDGKAEVNIDEASRMTSGTFEALCQDVQSYTTNESGWSLTKSYIVGNILHIEAQDETANDTISWLVIGERKDESMKYSNTTDENSHVIVEIPKSEEQS